jgi:hypothetical protein
MSLKERLRRHFLAAGELKSLKQGRESNGDDGRKGEAVG